MFESTDDAAVVNELREMLSDPNIEAAVRQGDIYASIVQYYVTNNNLKSAVSALQEMQQRLPKVNNYVYIYLYIF